MEKQTKPQTSSSVRADADQPAEVVIQFEPMVSKDPIIWNKRRYDYVFKVAHTNSGKDPWHIYCCDEQISWVRDAMQANLVLTQGHDFTDERGCMVVGGELCGSHRGRTILHQGLFEDDEPEANDLTEVTPLQSHMPDYAVRAEELARVTQHLVGMFDLSEDVAFRCSCTAFLN
tara:strand:- start:341 stop:862 length:522 start_codon:yes stop_codon:yes gene_type:complete